MIKTRLFGNVRYAYDSSFSSKHAAQRRADYIHDKGHLARMTRSDQGGWDVWYFRSYGRYVSGI